MHSGSHCSANARTDLDTDAHRDSDTAAAYANPQSDALANAHTLSDTHPFSDADPSTADTG